MNTNVLKSLCSLIGWRHVPASLLQLALMLMFVPAGAVHATTFTVNSVNDTVPAGACGAGIECTLRAAIQLANATPGADTIQFDPALDGRPLIIAIPNATAGGEDNAATGDLDILADLTITGNGARKTIIQGGTTLATSLDRVFDVASGVTANISGVTIRYGKTPPGDAGGGILHRGAGALTIKNSVISDNDAESGGGIAVFFGGDLTLDRVTVAANTAQFAGGGVTWAGGGAHLLVTNSTFRGNKAENTAGMQTVGGALRTGAGSIQAPLLQTIINSTFSGNSAMNGCAIAAGDGQMRLFNVTVANNCTAGSGGNSIRASSSENHSDVLLRNSVVISPAGVSNCFFLCCGASITSQGHNLSSDASCGLFGPGDMQNINPLLGNLSFNGGSTQTHALLAGSPAIDAGEPGCTNPDGVALTTDERGQPRPVGVACDMGAYEVQRALGGSSATVLSSTGAGAVTFTTSAGTFGSLDPIAEADLPLAGKPAGVTFPFGLFSWTLTGLALGQSATITMTYPSPIPTSVQYWKVIGDQWTNLTALVGSNDGDNILTLTMTDGGLGDADLAVNGQISDPGGVGVPPAPPVVPFANFTANLQIERHDFELKASFKVGAGSNGINPATEDVTLKMGTFSRTIHAGAFKADKKGSRFTFEGVVDGVPLEIEIRALGSGRFDLQAEGKGADLSGIGNPVLVSLTIGNDGGSTTVRVGGSEGERD